MPLESDPAPGGAPIYECFDCGERAEEAVGRQCDCGGNLRNIGVPRPQ